MRRILLTGFGPFRDVEDNPSARVARALDGVRIGDLRVHGAVLDVTWETVRVQMPALARELDPAIALSVGLGRPGAVRLETRASRTVSSWEPDVAGVVARGRRLDGDQELLACTWDAMALAAALDTPELPVRVSDDAGGYVCNAGLYHLLASLPTSTPAGFVHLPPLGEPPEVTCSRVVELVARILETLATTIGSSPFPRDPLG